MIGDNTAARQWQQIHDNISSRPTPEDDISSTSWKTDKLAAPAAASTSVRRVLG